MANLFQRLSGDVDVESAAANEQRIPTHYFYAALVGAADGQFTRTQIENKWNIATTGADKNQLDFIITGYQSAADKQRYLSALHAVFLLVESGEGLDATMIQDWLTAAQAAYS